MTFKVATRWITIHDCRLYPDEYFIFGDNMVKYGTGGQAQIRHEPNAVGIPTKISPMLYMTIHPSTLPESVKAVDEALAHIEGLLKDGHTVWYPMDGVGTGLARLGEHCPPIRKRIDEWVKRVTYEYAEEIQS